MMTEQEIAAHELSVAPVAVLLRTAYSLTHRMHELQTSAFYSDDVQRVRDLRAQRDLIDAEIERRCQR